jgi:hypothetical protein
MLREAALAAKFGTVRESTPLSLVGMNREQAQLARDRLAAAHPEATWLVAEQESGEWAVVKVGLTPADGPDGSATEARPKPDYAGDVRNVSERNRGGNWVAGG